MCAEEVAKRLGIVLEIPAKCWAPKSKCAEGHKIALDVEQAFWLR